MTHLDRVVMTLLREGCWLALRSFDFGTSRAQSGELNALRVDHDSLVLWLSLDGAQACVTAPYLRQITGSPFGAAARGIERRYPGMRATVAMLDAAQAALEEP